MAGTVPGARRLLTGAAGVGRAGSTYAPALHARRRGSGASALSAWLILAGPRRAAGAGVERLFVRPRRGSRRAAAASRRACRRGVRGGVRAVSACAVSPGGGRRT
ncbi:unnamed protein product [[Actinomadura] parvosata subsp. kistnae]|nr:unnamed protein product [Actinomadura parvosata subsp. kistnae]